MADRVDPMKALLDQRFPDVVKFRGALTPESDRGCALLAASFLDGELEALLRARLVDDAAAIDDFFRPDGPIGSFSARIDLAYLLGLIGPTARRDLHLMRKIRNDFGHNASPLTFSEPAIASRCRELSHTNLESDASPRSKYTNTVLGVTAVIHAALHLAEHLKAASDDYLPNEEARTQSRQLARALADAIIGPATSDKRLQRSPRGRVKRRHRRRR